MAGRYNDRHHPGANSNFNLTDETAGFFSNDIGGVGITYGA